MRRITVWAMSTLSVLVLLFSYHTSRSSVATVATVASGTRQAGTSQDSSGSSVGASGSSSDASSNTASAATAGTYTGSEVMTPYGVVQVQITVTDGRITTADAIQVPMSDRHDQMINSRAVPVYNSETVRTQSAGFDAISGATVTWEGYTSSLQSAIDQAHL